MGFTDIINLISDLTAKIAIAAWGLVGLSWVIGWLLRGSPIPISRIKRMGHSFVEDAIIAAIWLALGSTVFFIITTLAKQFAPQTTVTVQPPVKVTG